MDLRSAFALPPPSSRRAIVNCQCLTLTPPTSTREMKREPSWSEAAAFGSAEFEERIEGELLGDYSRRRLERTECESGAMVLREVTAPYGA